MKTVLYMAISADGFIAGPNDETPWSNEEWAAFQEFVKSCDTVLPGRRTYEIMSKQGEFVVGPEYIVVTSNASADTGNFRKVSIKNKSDLPQVDALGVIGGGELNGHLAELNVFDEMILDVEPITFGNGTGLFGSHDVRLNLALLESKRLGSGTLHNRYKVLGTAK